MNTTLTPADIAELAAEADFKLCAYFTDSQANYDHGQGWVRIECIPAETVVVLGDGGEFATDRDVWRVTAAADGYTLTDDHFEAYNDAVEYATYMLDGTVDALSQGVDGVEPEHVEYWRTVVADLRLIRDLDEIL